MSRFADTVPPDAANGVDGDRVLLGVSQATEPDALGAGLCWAAENVTFECGRADTRAGSSTPIDHQGAAGTALLGHGVFSDPEGLEYLLLATADGVWRSRFGEQPRLLATPAALVGEVTLAQGFRNMVLFRGVDDLPALQWDGNPVHGFVEVTDPASSSGRARIPNGPTRRGLRPVNIQNRLAVPHDRTELGLSDILDFTAYDRDFNDFNLTGGNDDVPTGIFRYNAATLLVFNDQSVQQLTGIASDLSGLSLLPISETNGCIAGGTIARFGRDVAWLSDGGERGGVFTLAEVQQRQDAEAVPISQTIQGIMDRVNWSAAGKSCAKVFGERYFLAVPLDDAEAPNAILPYNTATKQWEGIHWLPEGVQCDGLVLLDYHGKKRLHAIDYASGRVHLLYYGRWDYIGSDGSDRTPIALDLTTRGFTAAGASRTNARRGRMRVRTAAPSFSVAAITDGINESDTALNAVTYDRTQSMLTTGTPYDESNADDNHADGWREDYSIDPANDEDDTPRQPIDFGDNGIEPNLLQTHGVPFTFNSRGGYVQLRITNTTGHVSLCRIELETAEADRADIERA